MTSYCDGTMSEDSKDEVAVIVRTWTREELPVERYRWMSPKSSFRLRLLPSLMRQTERGRCHSYGET